MITETPIQWNLFTLKLCGQLVPLCLMGFYVD